MLRVTPDGKKTAYTAVCWEGRKERQLDMDMWLPGPNGGMRIPRVDGYKHLGYKVRGGWMGGLDAERQHTVANAKGFIYMTMNMPMLAYQELGRIASMGMAGIIGFRGRGTPLRYADCDEIWAAEAFPTWW